MKIIKPTSKQLEKICMRSLCARARIASKVAKIIEDVRLYGDDALIRYTRKFDKVKLLPRQLKVTQGEISAAFQAINPDFISALKVIIENVNKFYKKQISKSGKLKERDGIILGEKFVPIEKAGVYIPSGTAPLVSTVYMSVLPAKIAGVKKIILATPPDKSGNINPHILVVADLLKVDEVYKMGGAQAIAALAFGTKTVPRVDKIIGPGNIYVTEAKRQVFGFVDIDMIAGPTELVIIANKSSNPKFVVADLISQAEHAGALSILITNSKSLARQVRTQVPNSGFIVLAKNMDEVIDTANRIAPEHLEIMASNPKKILAKIKNAGAIFLGDFSPVSVGDYIAGPSHILPTGGTARFFSGLGVKDFIKSSHIISYSKKALEKIKEPLERVANIEGLSKHIESVKVRFEQEK